MPPETSINPYATPRAVVEATPHIKHRTSIVAWIVLVLIVLLIVLAFVGLPVR